MADIYAAIADVDESMQSKLCDVLELRGADTQQQTMRESYLSALDLPRQAKALEIGCGTGVVSRSLAALPGIESVMGIDPSPVFVERARQLSKDLAGIAFEVGDAVSLPFADESFDLVVFHTSLCHIPSPEKALAEAKRVLKMGGMLVVFDGDYASATVALDQHDPLQMAVDTMVSGYVENIWLIRQLPKHITNLGLKLMDFRSYAYSAVNEPAYMMTLIDRGLELMRSSGVVGQELLEGLKSEALRRVDAGEFFGQISYISVLAQKRH